MLRVDTAVGRFAVGVSAVAERPKKRSHAERRNEIIALSLILIMFVRFEDAAWLELF